LTRKESDLWATAQRLTDDLADYIVLLKLLNLNAAGAWWFATDKGIAFQKPAELERKLLELETKVSRMRELIRRVEDRDLSLQFRAGDIDIVDSSQNLDGWPIILAGVVIAAGIIAALYYYKSEADDLRPKYNRLLTATDRVFCKEGSPDTCAEWKQYKRDSGYTQRKSLADKIGDGLGKTVGAGSRWGLTIAIPLIALLLLYRGRR